MDARQIRHQLRVVEVTYRVEGVRLRGEAAAAYRERALAILDGLAAEAAAKNGLLSEIEALRHDVMRLGGD